MENKELQDSIQSLKDQLQDAKQQQTPIRYRKQDSAVNSEYEPSPLQNRFKFGVEEGNKDKHQIMDENDDLFLKINDAEEEIEELKLYHTE
jgi:hypothetical protein